MESPTHIIDGPFSLFTSDVNDQRRRFLLFQPFEVPFVFNATIDVGSKCLFSVSQLSNRHCDRASSDGHNGGTSYLGRVREFPEFAVGDLRNPSS